MSQKNHSLKEEDLKEYPSKNYLEERLDLLEKGILGAVDEKLVNLEGKIDRLDEKFDQFEKRFMSALGSTVVRHEQRITKLEEVVLQ